MKCRECHDYAKCAKESNLTIKRKNCPKAKTEKVKTNADRIRAMSDEELAKEMRSHAFALATCSEKAWLEWLQSPAEKEGE